MENPYKHAAAVPSTPEQQLASDYELAIGPNRAHYLPKFQEFDSGASLVGWNWPAFFVTSPWFMYRKMWLPGILNLVYPIVLAIVLAIVFGITRPPNSVMFVVAGLLWAAPWFLFPMFANALYWKHVRKLIDNLPSSIAQNPDKRVTRLERNGGTSAGAMIGVLFGLGFVGLFFGGILAAIAIPAYQDYTIRSQVQEGLTLSAGLKADVAEYYAQNGTWPADTAAIGAQAPSGLYVDSINVENGSVVILFGGRANANLANRTLVIQPGIDDKDDISWACGYTDTPSGFKAGPGPQGSDIPKKYLPSACRGSG